MDAERTMDCFVNASDSLDALAQFLDGLLVVAEAGQREEAIDKIVRKVKAL